MAMGTLEIMATIIIVFGVIKLLALLFNPKGWMNFAKRIYSNVMLTKIIFLVLAAVSLYYLVGAGVTIIEIFAVMLFFAFLAGIGIAPHAKTIMKNIKLKTLWSEHWLYTIVWILLLLWGIKELFL
jgi:hypothetical protein